MVTRAEIDVIRDRRRTGTLVPVDYRLFLPPAKNQMPFGSCAGCAMSALFEYYNFRRTQKLVEMSPAFLWYYFRSTLCPDHSQLKDINEGARRTSLLNNSISKGCCPEINFRYNRNTTHYVNFTNPIHYDTSIFKEPPASAQSSAITLFSAAQELGPDENEWIAELFKGNILYIGVERYPSNFDDFSNDLLDETGLTVEKGHGMVLVGYLPDYNGKEVFIVRNSYGTIWKDKGYAYYTIPCLKHCLIFNPILFISNAPPPAPKPPVKPAVPPAPPPPPPGPTAVTVTLVEPHLGESREVGDNTPIHVVGRVDGPHAHYNYAYGIYNNTNALAALAFAMTNVPQGESVPFDMGCTDIMLPSGSRGQLPHGTYRLFLWAQVAPAAVHFPLSCAAPDPHVLPESASVEFTITPSAAPTPPHPTPPPHPAPTPTPHTTGKYTKRWVIFRDEDAFREAVLSHLPADDLIRNGLAVPIDSGELQVDPNRSFTDDSTINIPPGVIVGLGACLTASPNHWKWDSNLEPLTAETAPVVIKADNPQGKEIRI